MCLKKGLQMLKTASESLFSFHIALDYITHNAPQTAQPKKCLSKIKFNSKLIIRSF